MSIEARVVRRLAAVRDSPAFTLDVQLAAPAGITVVLGPSGAGKTLLLNSIAGFARPDEGRILVRDRIYFDAAANVQLAPERRRCGYIFQDHALFPHMTVRENLRFAAQSAGVGRLEARRRMSELLESFDLSQLADRRSSQLSGGQRQRAALARILMTDPHLLLLDEPSRGLDPRLRRAFWELLRELKRRIEIPILLVTHDIEECCELADRIAILESGRLLQSGTREEVIRRPASVGVARLLGLHNIAPAEIRSLDPAGRTSRLRVLGQELEGPHLPGHLIGDTGFLCVLQSEMKPVRGNGNRLVLRVETVQRSAAGVQIQLEHGFTIALSQSEYAGYADSDSLSLTAPVEAMAFTGR
ncbi:MAG TPA: ABC transporter ATP-binding protein [Bryobacteraceae bacterium]|jgi:molybdate transport system ATP-binding protein|nr:ABC transporter ATP-binding protein [Bryobacteraceae bacterium]